MKKYLYLIGAFLTGLSSTSCKKDFTCSCTSTNTNSSDAYVSETTIKEATKKAAQANCVSTESEGTTYTYNYTTGTLTQVPVTYTSTCELD